jgi:hypothetical protein
VRLRLGILLTVGAVLALASIAQSAAGHVKLSLTGPLTGIKLYTPYVYAVKLVPTQNTRKATIRVSWTGCTGVHKTIRLMAGHPWVGKFTVTYEAIRVPETLRVAVIGPPSKYASIVAHSWTVKPEAGQAEHGIKCETYIGS